MRLQEFEPLGMFYGKNKQRYTIRGHHVANLLQKACCLAYPDADHYMRLHILMIQAHSFRVFACVALANMGVNDDDISFRLRWNSDAVKLYLRDCYRTIGDLTNRAIAGAYADF